MMLRTLAINTPNDETQSSSLTSQKPPNGNDHNLRPDTLKVLNKGVCNNT